MAKIKKQSLVDQTYLALREDILSLRYPLGSRLNVSDIQEELGVSSTPLREALNRLQQEGLVIQETNVGASVPRLDEHDVLEIEELALVLQTAAVRLSLARGDRARMIQSVEEQLGRYEAAGTPSERTQAVFELIGTFYRNCGNRRLDNSMIALQGQVLLLRNIYARCPASQEDKPVWEKVLHGLRQGDAEGIVRALRSYSQKSARTIIAWLEEQP